jgi:hypothetical protein
MMAKNVFHAEGNRIDLDQVASVEYEISNIVFPFFVFQLLLAIAVGVENGLGAGIFTFLILFIPGEWVVRSRDKTVVYFVDGKKVTIRSNRRGQKIADEINNKIADNLSKSQKLG